MEILKTIITVNFTGMAALFSGVVIFIVGMIVYRRDPRRMSNIFFLLLCTSCALWGIAIGVLVLTIKSQLFLPIAVLVYFFSATIPITFLFFALTLSTERISLLKFQLILAIIPIILIEGAILMPGFIIQEVLSKPNVPIIIHFGKGFPFFMAYLIFYLLWSLAILIKRYQEGAGIFKAQLRHVLFVSVIAVTLALTTNLFLPLWGIFTVFAWGPIFVMVALLGIGYLIIKYNLWNLKLVATELFAFLIIITLIVEIVITTSLADFVTKVSITLLVAFSSIFLIRSVRNEVESKEEVEKLLKDLAYANDELQTLDKRKSEFLSIASHHLRDPLTAIKGYASMLLEGSFGGELSPAVKEAIQKILESSKRLVTIVEDFLNISQIEQGEMVYTLTSVDIKKLVHDVVEEMSPSVSRAGLDMELIADGISNEGSTIQGDAGKLRQVITNLIDNSIKYTPKGSVRVMLTHTERGGKTFVQLSVTDTGIGMDKSTQEKIFNKFSRAEGVSKLYTDGSGLGLYVAKEILKKHNGRIWAESQGLGSGSTFFIEFPVGNSSNSEIRES